MAGDIPGDELVFVAGGTTDGDEAVAATAGDPTQVAPGRVIHRYGRVHVVAGAEHPATARPRTAANGDTVTGGALAGTVLAGIMAADEVPDDVAAGLDDAERLGLAALALRDSGPYREAKDNRPRAGEEWDHRTSCVDVVPVPPRGASGGGAVPTLVSPPPDTDTDTDAGASGRPTSSYLEGSVAVGLVIVEGPTADLQFSAAERTKVVAEVQNGLSFYATADPPADISFTYDIQIVRVDAAPQPGADDEEAVWRDPAMATLGYQATFDGVYDYVDDLRSRLGTRWSYAAYVTKYPVKWFAYSAIGGPRLVLQYDNNGWGPDNIDRVFAHETGHIFGAVDEYATSGCDCGGSQGRFHAPNGNCAACNPDSLACLMKGNDFALCRFTPAHLGWGRGVAGNPSLVQGRLGGGAGNFEVVAPSVFSGLDHVWRDNSVAGAPWRDPFQAAWAAGPIDAVSMIFSTLGSLEVVARYGPTLSFLWRDGGPALRWRDPAPIGAGARGVPSLTQSRFGRVGNFELVCPATAGGLFHLYRDNDLPSRPWSRPTAFGSSLGQVEAATVIQSNLGGGSLEVVVQVGGSLLHVYRTPTGVWDTAEPTPVVDGVGGGPSMIQGRFGRVGNFELVAPAADGGLLHVWRDNDAANFPWRPATYFGGSIGQVTAASLIQSNLGGGSLEVVAQAGGRLYHFWRGPLPPWDWHGPTRVL